MIADQVTGRPSGWETSSTWIPTPCTAFANVPRAGMQSTSSGRRMSRRNRCSERNSASAAGSMVHTKTLRCTRSPHCWRVAAVRARRRSSEMSRRCRRRSLRLAPRQARPRGRAAVHEGRDSLGLPVQVPAQASGEVRGRPGSPASRPGPSTRPARTCATQPARPPPRRAPDGTGR
jgi:hypothetical protein